MDYQNLSEDLERARAIAANLRAEKAAEAADGYNEVRHGRILLRARKLGAIISRYPRPTITSASTDANADAPLEELADYYSLVETIDKDANTEPVISADADDNQGADDRLGVSMKDAALILTRGDPDLAKEKKAAWQKLRTPKCPDSIGICPKHRQIKLFAPKALCDWLEKVEDPRDCKQLKLRQELRKIARRPRP